MICYLIRHGKDDDSVRGGWSSHGLTSFGIAQAEKLAEELSAVTIEKIISSDLQRAAETAEILAAHWNVPVIYDPAFREVNNGVLAGMKNEEADLRYPGLYWSALEYDECYPQGESPAQFFHRIRAAWERLKQESDDQNIALVTHGGVIEAILCMENGIACSNREKHFSVPNAAAIPMKCK